MATACEGPTLTLCESFEGQVTLLHQGKTLPYQILAEGEPPTPLDDEKSIHQTVDQAKARQNARPHHKPAPDHPWRQRARIAMDQAAQK